MSDSDSRGDVDSQESISSPPVPLNWGNIWTGMIEREYSEEVPLFWDGADEFVNPKDIFINAWDEFHEFSYSDLLHLKERLGDRVEKTRDAIVQKGGHFQIPVEKLPDDNEKGSPVMSDFQKALEETVREQGREDLLWLYRTYTYFYRRKQAASALARCIEEKGSPPGWEELTEQERNRLRSSGSIQPHHRSRVKAVLQNLDPQADAKDIFQDASDQLVDQGQPVGPDQIRKKLKEAFKIFHNFEGRLKTAPLCKYVPREAERVGILVEEHIPPEAEKFAK